jgi:hypothetical protein
MLTIDIEVARRFTGQWYLQPLKYGTLREFFPLAGWLDPGGACVGRGT